MVSQSTCKMFPSLHVLYFVEEEYRFIVIHCAVRLQYQVEIFRLHPQKSFVIKVDVYNLLDVMTFLEKLFGTLIKQIRLACLSYSDKHITSLRLKIKRPLV